MENAPLGNVLGIIEDNKDYILDLNNHKPSNAGDFTTIRLGRIVHPNLSEGYLSINLYPEDFGDTSPQRHKGDLSSMVLKGRLIEQRGILVKEPNGPFRQEMCVFDENTGRSIHTPGGENFRFKITDIREIVAGESYHTLAEELHKITANEETMTLCCFNSTGRRQIPSYRLVDNTLQAETTKKQNPDSNSFREDC